MDGMRKAYDLGPRDRAEVDAADPLKETLARAEAALA